MNETLAVIVAVAVCVGAVLTCLNSFIGFLSLIRGGKRDTKLSGMVLQIDGKWSEALEVAKQQELRIAALTQRVEELLVKSSRAEGVVEGKADPNRTHE